MKKKTSNNESVEVVEVTWTIPNFLSQPATNFYNTRLNDCCKRFFIGGRVPSVDCQIFSPLPIKFETCIDVTDEVSPAYHLNFQGFHVRSNIPSNSILKGKLLDLQVLTCNNTLKVVAGEHTKSMNFIETRCHKIKLFQRSEAENYVDKEDGSLKIYFKLEVTFSILKPTTGNLVTGVTTELVNDFESLLKNSRNADLEIKVSQAGGQSFRCHKAILTARSEVFCEMFSSGMKESKENVVEVDDILPAAMEHFISFLYCGRFHDSSWIPWLPQLAYAADKYCVKSLKPICDANLILCATSKNVLALGKLAERHELVSALKDIRKYIAEYAAIISFDSVGTDVDTIAIDENFKRSYFIP